MRGLVRGDQGACETVGNRSTAADLHPECDGQINRHVARPGGVAEQCVQRFEMVGERLRPILEPGENAGVPLVECASRCADRKPCDDLLDELGLPSWIKTSGSKGFHIVVPLDGKADVGRVAGFANTVGTLLVKRHAKTLTQEFSKADRGGRILVDTGRNGYSATFAAVYAVRPKPGAPVSAPCTWEEVERGTVGPRTFTLQTMAERVAAVGDLWADMRRRRRALRPAIERLQVSSARGRSIGG